MFSMPDSNTKYTSCTGRLVNQDGGYPESSKFPALYYSLSPRTPTKSNNFNSHHRKNSSSAMSLSSSRKYIHLYKDHRNDPLVVHVPTLHRGATRQFPNKLYEMLFEASKLGFEDIISWQPHGRAFLVRKADAFVTEVMQRYVSTFLKNWIPSRIKIVLSVFNLQYPSNLHSVFLFFKQILFAEQINFVSKTTLPLRICKNYSRQGSGCLLSRAFSQGTSRFAFGD